MLVSPQKIKIKWNVNNKKVYIEKGYKFTNMKDEFEIDVLDLPLNSKQKVNIVCDFCSKILLKEYRNVQRNREHSCDDCKWKKVPKTRVKRDIEFIKKEFEKRNFVLLEKEYKKHNVHYECICDNGHQTSTTFQKLLDGKGCEICLLQELENNRKRLREEVNIIFQENGCVLLTIDFINYYQKLDYICECGKTSKTTLSHFLDGKRCKDCGNRKIKKANSKYDLEKIKNIFKENGCELLDDEYVNFHTPMNFRCACGRESKKSLTWFLKAPRCKECSIKNNSGEKHYKWNPNLTIEERENERNIEGYSEWRHQVYERDNYTCQYCNKRGCGTLNAHHLDGYDWCIEKRIDIDNGITLCSSCHNDFHKIYGFGNNTKNQFEEWLNNK